MTTPAVTHAADSHAGVRKLERGGRDALMLDLMLPGIDGLEICHRAGDDALNTDHRHGARSSEVHRILELELELELEPELGANDDNLARAPVPGKHARHLSDRGRSREDNA